MAQFIIRRVFQAIPLLILITIVVFVMLKFAGDPVAATLANDPRVTAEQRALMRESLGLNDPIPLQFLTWLIGDTWRMRDLNGDGEPETQGQRLGILRGDLGESFRHRKPVGEVIAFFLPRTLLLGTTAYIVTVLFGLGIGIFAALRQYSRADNIITTISFITFSMPIFLIALLSVFIFAVTFKKLGLPYLPVQGMYDVRGDQSIWDLARHMVLPVFSLAAISIAGYSRFIRASMLEVINSDYVRTARAKGLADRRVTYVHALKNASLPLVTLMGLDIPLILSGAIVTETVYSWPGMGRLFWQQSGRGDYPTVMAILLLVATAVVIFQILTDIVYTLIDPRIRLS